MDGADYGGKAAEWFLPRFHPGRTPAKPFYGRPRAAPNLERLGISTVNARTPDGLLGQAGLVDEMSQDPDLPEILGEALFEDFDLQARVERIRPAVEALRSILKEVDETRRLVDGAVIAKQEAMKKYDKVFLSVARIFEEYCRFAGQDELAAKVRRRPCRPP